jgi:uncharacterized protein YegL
VPPRRLRRIPPPAVPTLSAAALPDVVRVGGRTAGALPIAFRSADTAPAHGTPPGPEPQAKGVLMPFYLVLGFGDEHRSAGEEMILALRDELATRPTVSDHVRLAIIEFDAVARVRLPLSDPLDPDLRIPPPSRRGADRQGGGETSNGETDTPDVAYGAALDAVYTAIAEDVPALMAVSSGVRRPLVWLLADRAPTDDPASRAASFRDLTGGAGYPFVVASAVGDVADDDLRALLYPVEGDTVAAGYTASDPAAIGRIGSLLTRTILAVAGRVERGDTDVVVLPGDDGLTAGIRRLLPAGR